MDEESWNLLIAATSEYCQSRSDPCIEEIVDGDEDYDDEKVDFSCPYCSEMLDIVELCHHIDDEHPSEDDTLDCPVCATSVDMDMVDHITARHGNLYRIQAKLKQVKGKSHSSISYLKNELQDERRKSLLSSQVVSLASDPLLSSFIYNLPMVSEPKKSAQPSCSTEPSLAEKSSDEINSERKIQPSSLSDKEHVEKERKCEFVKGVLWSTMFDDR